MPSQGDNGFGKLTIKQDFIGSNNKFPRTVELGIRLFQIIFLSYCEAEFDCFPSVFCLNSTMLDLSPVSRWYIRDMPVWK